MAAVFVYAGGNKLGPLFFQSKETVDIEVSERVDKHDETEEEEETRHDRIGETVPDKGCIVGPEIEEGGKHKRRHREKVVEKAVLCLCGMPVDPLLHAFQRENTME